MSAKHFQTIAETLNLSFRHAPNQQADNILTTLAVNLADDFEKFNPNFNRSRFLAVALA